MREAERATDILPEMSRTGIVLAALVLASVTSAAIISSTALLDGDVKPENHKSVFKTTPQAENPSLLSHRLETCRSSPGHPLFLSSPISRNVSPAAELIAAA